MELSLEKHANRQSRILAAPVLYLPNGSRHRSSGFAVDAKPKPVIVTGTLLLPQDSAGPPRLIETIEVQNPKRLQFLNWQNDTYSIVPAIEHQGRIYAPPKKREGLLAEITLPTGVRPCSELSELLRDIRAAIAQFVEISDRHWLLIQAWLLANWFPELFDAAPYIWLIGPPGSAKTKLLRLLSCFCRRALVVGDIRARRSTNSWILWIARF